MVTNWPQVYHSAACGRRSAKRATKPLVGREVLKPEPSRKGAPLSRHFAMLVSPSPARSALPSGGPAAKDPGHCGRYPQLHPVAGCDEPEAGEEDRLRADLASRILSGPGLWTDWLEELDRPGLIEELLADGVIEEAVATAPHGHQLDRELNAKTTVICVLADAFGGAHGRHETQAPHRRPCPDRVPALDRGGGRRLPRRGERAGR